MHAPLSRKKTTTPVLPNAALCAGAMTRLGWAAGALVLLWVTIHWALT